MLHNLLKGLSWQQKTVYLALCIAVVAIVSWWRIGILAIALLVLLSIAKLVCSRRVGNPALSRPHRIAFWAMIAYWLVYVASAIACTEQAEAWLKVSIKLYFLILPVLCLIADTSYLTRPRIRFLFQLLTVSLLVRIPINVLVAAFRFSQGASFLTIGVGDWQIDPLGLNHNYLALYINTALAFLYFQMVRTDIPLRKRKLPLLLTVAAALVAYLFYSASRSGILVFALLTFAALLHLTFVRKKWKATLCVLMLSPLLLFAVYCIKPLTFVRFKVLFSTQEQARVHDDREMLWQCGLKTAMQRPVFGYGSGDYIAPFHETCVKEGFLLAAKNHLDTHNLYINTLLETGFVGLAFLIFMLFYPMWLACRNKSRSFLTVLCILVATGQMAFETILNRQMGTQFTALFYCLLVLSMTARTTVAGESATSAPHLLSPSQTDAS